MNSVKYINKRWKGTTKECRVEIVARERTEDICYYIAAYTSDPKNVGYLAEGLFYIALDEGDTKIDFITIQLFDSIFSDNETYRKSMEEVEVELKEREQIIANRVSKDSRIKSVSQEKKVMFLSQINLLCELESRYLIK